MTHFIFSSKRSRVTKALYFKLQISHYRNVLCTAAFRLSFSGDIKKKKKTLSYHIYFMAYLACFSERHLANKITSLSAILNNILATYVMQLLLQLRMSMFSNPFQNTIISPPKLSVKQFRKSL